MARTTAAHSTVTFCDQPAGHFVDSGTTKRLLDGIPIVGGPRLVEVAREDHNGGTLLRAAHDGYSDEFGVIHQRALMLSADGKRIDGEEFFTATRSNASLVGRDNFAVRFHLHPMIKANRLTDSHGAMLLLPNKDVWSFNPYEDRVEIEKSVYLAGNQGPRRTTQIVIYGHARKIARVQWTFSFAAASPIGIVRRPRNEEKTDPM